MRALPELLILSGLLIASSAACGGSGGGGGTDPEIDAGEEITPVAPTNVTMVASGGFEGPMDVVASPDGKTFYFTAHDTTGAVEGESSAAIFKVDAAGGTPEILAGGEPLEDPSGLVISCDGATLYVADLGTQSEESSAEQSPIYTARTSDGALATFSATGVGEAAGLALSTDCSTIYVSGYKPDGTPAVFTVPAAGGAATVLKEGAPLQSPSGVHVDADSIAWVMDHQDTESGGALFAITVTGETTVVASNLNISEPAGVSLVAGGRIAVIPVRDRDGASQLMTIDTVSGEETIVEVPEMIEPAGIRTATQAAVMAVVDADGDAIYRAE
jgi:sugar lactone lactonase YvrE